MSNEPLTVEWHHPKIHVLKEWPEYFAEVVQGRKHYEIRLNDRGFEVGDLLLLREYRPRMGVTADGKEIAFNEKGEAILAGYTGLWTVVEITSKFAMDGITSGYCALGTKPFDAGLVGLLPEAVFNACLTICEMQGYEEAK